MEKYGVVTESPEPTKTGSAGPQLCPECGSKLDGPNHCPKDGTRPFEKKAEKVK